MTSLATVFEHSNTKTCFLYVKPGKRRLEIGFRRKLMVYEAVLQNSKKAFFSLSGDAAEIKSGDYIMLNGWYAEKLGINNNQEVMLKPVRECPCIAMQVNITPVTEDDWEILERSAAQVERGVLNQIRVVWPGLSMPVWIERSICIYLTVESVEPGAAFAVLDNTTIVKVAPKVRSQLNSSGSRPPALKMPPRQNAQDMTGNTPPFVGETIPSLKYQSLPRPSSQSVDSAPIPRYRKSAPARNKRNSRSDPAFTGINELSQKPQGRRHTDKVMKSVLMELVSSLIGYQNNDESGTQDQDDFDDLSSETMFTPKDNLVYRIQTSDLTTLYENIKNALEQDEVDGNDHEAPAELLQPSTIYVSVRDVFGHKLGESVGQSSPRVYYAELKKLPSPQDREKAQAEAKDKAQLEAKKASEKGKEKVSPPPPVIDDESNLLRCIVRVVTVERASAVTSPPWQRSAFGVLGEHGLAKGHAVMTSELRRQLKLDVTGCLWLKAGNVKFTRPSALILYPLSIVPQQIDHKTLVTAFKKWVQMVADIEHPLVVFHGMMVKFRVTLSVSVEAQICLASGQGSCSLLSQSNVHTASVIVHEQHRDDQPVPGIIAPLLAYRRVDDFDPRTPIEKLHLLGGVQGLSSTALKHLEACLGTRPLPRKLFGDRPGLNHGLLLLTGPKGSGKTCLARALCNQVSRFPTLAYTFTVDCKPLRGKRVETVGSLLEAAFDEATWRQPAVIVLDDLDVIAPAPDNPAAEMTAEAVYAAKVSEVLEGLVKFEMRNFSRLALIVTSQSRSSLHHSIVASRGLHFVQEVTTIIPPDKNGRKELLQSILASHSTVSAKATLERLDIDGLASRTEGFVARDLLILTNRALHSSLAAGPMDGKTVTLLQADFEKALEGFKPLAIRNVPLHTAGDLGWSDVGGLEEVKGSLRETLQWPSKYPQLFANCPLRLRSGVLLYGPPGTGKTLLAGAVARECCLNFISIKGPELLSKYIGASEQAVRDLFIRAQSAKPCVLFFDEFDSIAPKRGHDSTGVTDRVVNQLLTQLDGVEGLQGVYMLAATSRPDLIDPALLRPGRLDKCLFCNIPSQDERRSILHALTSKMRLCDEIDLVAIADMCEYFTGADFKALLYNAQLQAIHEYADAERVLGSSLVRIKGSPDSCSLATKPPITISAKNSPLSPAPASPRFKLQSPSAGDFVEDGKQLAVVKVTELSSTKMPMPGPCGDAPPVIEECIEDMKIPETRGTPPNQLEIDCEGCGKTGQKKGQAVTFFPKMGDAPAILTPEDEARFLNMVETIHRRQDLFVPTHNLDRRRASSVLAKPSVMVPVGQKHLLAAAKSMKPSVSLSERQRYQAIYDNFVTGRQGDFHTGNQQTGMRTTLA